jgi:FtsH-binding integral membrane protein
MTNQNGQDEFGTTNRNRVALIGLAGTAIIAVVAALVGIIDSATARPWLSFVLTIVVIALVIGLLPRMRGWHTVPWVSIAMVAVIAAGFVSSSGVIIGLGALLFVIATGAHGARSRRSSGAAR